MTDVSPTRGEGIQFPAVDGKRSSQRTGRELFAAAVRATDPDLAKQITSTDKWRKSYLEPVRKIVETGISSAANASTIARDGLNAARDTLVFERNGEVLKVAEAFLEARADRFATSTIQGRASRPSGLQIPVGDEVKQGDGLRRQLDDWVDAGTIEPSSAEAVKLVVANPDWLDLSDAHFAVLGAASEMGPMRALCSWGATVYALDLPNPVLWKMIVEFAQSGSGRVVVPTSRPVDDPSEIVDSAGTDLLSRGPEAAAWLAAFDKPMVVGDYTYADGTTFVQLSVGVDALINALRAANKLRAIAYLATPTDAFAVPEYIVAETRARKPSLPIAGLQGLGRVVSLGRLYGRNYRQTFLDDEGRTWSVSDCLVPQQGANYALAKSLQRWRAMTLRSDGVVTSANVAPATRTRSVVKNPILAAAYAGAGAFGVDVFEPHTSRALMSALLVHDLRNPKAPANPENKLTHPYDLFADAAAHGGMWRLHNEPRSILPLAVLIGLAKRRGKKS